jgi:hypothetical protein
LSFVITSFVDWGSHRCRLGWGTKPNSRISLKGYLENWQALLLLIVAYP